MQGLRRYTDWEQKDPKYPDILFSRNTRRRAIVVDFIHEVEKLITDSTAAGKLHAHCGRNRMTNHHAKHTSSNYIMNLVHTIIMA